MKDNNKTEFTISDPGSEKYGVKDKDQGRAQILTLEEENKQLKKERERLDLQLDFAKTRIQLLEKDGQIISTALRVTNDIDDIKDSGSMLDHDKVPYILSLILNHTNLDYLYFELNPKFSMDIDKKPMEFLKSNNVHCFLSDEIKRANVNLLNYSEYLKSLRNKKILPIIDHNKVKNEFYYGINIPQVGEIDVANLPFNITKVPGDTIGVAQVFKIHSGLESAISEADKFLLIQWQKHADTAINRLWNLNIKETEKPLYTEQEIMGLTSSFTGASEENKKLKKAVRNGWEEDSYMDKNKELIKNDLERLVGIRGSPTEFDFICSLGMDNPQEFYPNDLYKVSELASKLVLEIGKKGFKYNSEAEISLIRDEQNANWIKAMVFISTYALGAPYLKDSFGNPLSKETSNLEELTNALNEGLNKIIPQDQRQKYAAVYMPISKLSKEVNEVANITEEKHQELVVKLANIIEASIKYAAYYHKSNLTNDDLEIGKAHEPRECLEFLKKKGYNKEMRSIASLVLKQN